MLTRRVTRCILRPQDVQPSREDTRVVGAFNPGVAEHDGKVVLLTRIVEEPLQTRAGHVASPSFRGDGTLSLDWLAEREHDLSDPRKYVHRATGITRLRFYSYLKVFTSSDGLTLDGEGVSIFPQGPYETYGIEDPRITQIGDTYYITYVGVSRHGVNTHLMTTTDFQRFERLGIIFVCENKDVMLFPEMIGGRYAALHRPVPSMQFTPPAMWIAHSPDLEHWGGHRQVLGAERAWQNSRIGGGTPPVRTDAGWLTFYHGSQRRPDQPVGRYTAGLMLLDAQEPALVLGLSPEPVFVPAEDFETGGYVADVVFPTGMVERGDEYLVYYGAADANTGVVAFNQREVLDAVERV